MIPAPEFCQNSGAGVHGLKLLKFRLIGFKSTQSVEVTASYSLLVGNDRQGPGIKIVVRTYRRSFRLKSMTKVDTLGGGSGNRAVSSMALRAEWSNSSLPEPCTIL